MAIIQITTDFPGQVNVHPQIVRIVSTDNFTTISQPGYLNSVIDQGYIIDNTDLILISYDDDLSIPGSQFGLFTLDTTNSVNQLTQTSTQQFAAGTNITFTTDPMTGQITISAAGGGGGLVTPTFGGTGISNPTAGTIPIAEGAGNFNFVPLTNGQLLVGSTGLDPVAATPTDGTNISWTGGAGTLQADLTGTIPLANGGSNANLTADNGGIIYSTATAMAILGSTATADQVLLSGSNTMPAWSTASYPATTTINQILYSSANNTIGGLVTSTDSVLVTDGSGVPSLSNTLPAFIAPSITFNSTSGIIGTTTNDDAAIGSVGELQGSVVPFASAVSVPSSVTPADVTSILLGAGDWDVWGNVFFIVTGVTIQQLVWISSTSATQPDLSILAGLSDNGGLSNNGFIAPSLRFSLAAPTTIYISVVANFSTGTVTACGGIYARRVR